MCPIDVYRGTEHLGQTSTGLSMLRYFTYMICWSGDGEGDIATVLDNDQEFLKQKILSQPGESFEVELTNNAKLTIYRT